MDNNFAELRDQSSFQRVDNTHILDLYVGSDDMSRQTLLLITDNQPAAIDSSQIINVTVGNRKDGKWATSFSLINDDFDDMFNYFCKDIIESSRSITNKGKGSDYISSRYTKWQNMLAKLNGELLSPSAIKGLVGELCFLRDCLIPKYGQDVAVNSWIGPEKADQDFVCENTWYEVKATVSGAESVRIASVEQLDMPIPGVLAVVYLDKSSASDNMKVTLNSIFTEVSSLLTTESLKNKLSGILLNLGYYCREEYDKPAFKLSKIDRYSVNSDFPSIRRKDIPAAIVNSKYILSLSSIDKYREEN